MTTEQASTAADEGGTGGPRARWRHRRRWVVVLTLLVTVAAGVVAFAVHQAGAKGTSPSAGTSGNADPTSLATVTRQDLSSQTEVTATLGYAGSYSVVNEAQGTITGLPAAGQVVSQGHVLYQVDGNPVVLLYGSTPDYRTLSSGLTGPDVAELNADLVALGDATARELPAGTDEFTYWTTAGVEKLQATLGVAQTGTLTLGQAVVLPTAARVATVSANLGGTVQVGQAIMTATSTSRQVSIALGADQQSEVAVGDKVTITLPNNRVTPGVISSVGTVATAPASGSPDSTPTITVLVNPTDPAATGSWDQAPVNVTITTTTVHGVLVVPVDALLSQAGGGYAVEVASAGGRRHLVPVTLGLFDDAEGLVQVNGPELTAGEHVVVPAT